MRLSLLLVTLVALSGAATAAATPPSSGQTISAVSGSGTSQDGSTSTVTVNWGYNDAVGELTYARPCSVYVNAESATPTADTFQATVGEDETSWTGTVPFAPGQTVYVGLTLSLTPIGVAAHDCSHPSYTGVVAVTITTAAAAPSAPTPTTTTTDPVAADPVVVDPAAPATVEPVATTTDTASETALQTAVADGASPDAAALAARSAGTNALYQL